MINDATFSSDLPCARRPRVLLLAYSISPIRGSEYSVGWNHVTHMSAHCDLTVIFGLAGPHMGDIEEIENYVHQHGQPDHVRFVPILPNHLAKFLNAPNRAGFLVYSFYLAYRVWHWQAARKVRDIIDAEPIDLIHYLCPIGYREPSYLWKLGKPFVWGPIGGLVSTLNLSGSKRPWKAIGKVKLKNLANRINLSLSGRVRNALASSDTIIAATSENFTVLNKRFGVTPLLIQENAIPDESLYTQDLIGDDPDRPLRLIWIGSLDWRKSPDLLLDTLASVASRRWTIDIIGTGTLLAQTKARALELGIHHQVNFHGQISRMEVQTLLIRSDLHLVTSMNEGNPTTIWEAMAACVPTLTLDHCGMHDVVCSNCGVRVPLSDYNGTKDRLAAEIDHLVNDRRKIVKLKNGVLACRNQHLWSKRSLDWLKVYHRVMSIDASDNINLNSNPNTI